MENNTLSNSEDSGAAIGETSSRTHSQSLPSFEQYELSQIEFDSVCRLHKTAVKCIVPHSSLPSTNLLTIGDDGFLRDYIVDKSKVDTFIVVSSRPLICLKAIQVRSSIDSDEQYTLAFIGGYDRTLYIYNLQTGTSIFSKVLHDDVITDLYITRQSTPTLLFTSSHDATVCCWSLENFIFTHENNYILESNNNASNIQIHYDVSFDSSCTCMHILEEHSLLTVGCQDGTISICNLQTGDIVKKLTSSSPILSLSLHPDGHFLAYLTSKTVTLVDILTGTDVFMKTCSSDNQSFSALFYLSQTLVIGLSDGSCDIWNLKVGEKVHTLKITDDICITTIAYNHGMLFFGTDDGSVHSYTVAKREQSSI